MPRAAPWGPNDHHHPAAQITGREVPPLAIFEAIVREHGMKAFEHLCRVGEIEASLRQRLLALGLVEGDLNLIYVPPINPASQHLWGVQK